VELWNAVMASGTGGRAVALQSALQLLAAPPGPPAAPAIKGPRALVVLIIIFVIRLLSHCIVLWGPHRPYDYAAGSTN
jgi:hypothetical protein